MTTGPGAAPLLLVGAGGLARETVEVVNAINATNEGRPTWDLLGFLDDDPALWGEERVGTTVLGPIDSVHSHPDARIVVCTGHPGNYLSRRQIVERLDLPPDRYATLVHPAAVISRSSVVGPGTVVLAGAVATACVTVGSHVAVMPHVALTHDDVVGDYVNLGAGARLAGTVRVGEGAYIGAGALIREGRTIGAWSLVGMGAVVTHDVPPAEVWVGVPARRLRAADVPQELVAR